MHLGIDFCNIKKMTNFEPHHFYSLYLRSSITDFGPRLSWSAIYFLVNSKKILLTNDMQKIKALIIFV